MHSHESNGLFHIDNPEKHDVRYFAMLNNAVAVIDTSLEGGKNAESFAYYQYLLNVELPKCPLDFNLTSEQSQALKQGIAKLSLIQALLEQGNKSSTLYTNEFLDDLIHIINMQSIASGNSCYLPSGWQGKIGESGHFAGLKFRRLENGHHAISVLNQGSGAEYHSRIIGSNRNKGIYQSHEYEVDLQRKNGLQFLYQLIAL